MTWAAESNPVRKRALGASRRDICFVSFAQQGHPSWVVCVLDEGTMESRHSNFQRKASYDDDS